MNFEVPARRAGPVVKIDMATLGGRERMRERKLSEPFAPSWVWSIDPFVSDMFAHRYDVIARGSRVDDMAVVYNTFTSELLHRSMSRSCVTLNDSYTR